MLSNKIPPSQRNLFHPSIRPQATWGAATKNDLYSLVALYCYGRPFGNIAPFSRAFGTATVVDTVGGSDGGRDVAGAANNSKSA